MEPKRLFNHYGSTTGNQHAEVIDEIMDRAMERIAEYLKEHDVCPRDTMGYCVMSVTNHMADYTLRRAFKIKKEEQTETKIKFYRPNDKDCFCTNSKPYLMGKNKDGWSAYFRSGFVRFHGNRPPFDYSDLVESGGWVECEWPERWASLE